MFKMNSMKNSLFFASILLLAFNFISCKTTRNMKYFQDLNTESQKGMPREAPDYRIKADDNLYINVQSMNQEVNQLFSPSKSVNSSGGTQADFGQESSQYLNGYLVNQRGSILLPVIGEINVGGLTEEEAKDAVQKKVSEYFKDATVKVKILTYKVTILGEVRNPGVYYNYNKSLTILDALGLANGTTDNATVRKLLVIRTTSNGSKSFRLDLTEKKTMSSEAFYLLPNDVLYVDPDKYKNLPLNSTLFTITLSAITSTILVLSYLKK